MNRVVVVSGPPGSGKTTHVAQFKEPGDLVWDLDAVSAALGFPSYPRPADVSVLLGGMLAEVLQYARGGPRDCWIIATDGAWAARMSKHFGWEHAPQARGER